MARLGKILENYQTGEKCTICGDVDHGGNTLHHLRSQGAGGTDDPYNLMPLCDKHHTKGIDAIHIVGRQTFINKFPQARSWMKRNGWEFCEASGKWWRPL